MRAAKQMRSDLTTELVDQLFAAAADVMVVLDADGRIARINTQAEELFGYSQEELLGQKPDLLISTPRRDRNVKHRFGQVVLSNLNYSQDSILVSPGPFINLLSVIFQAVS
jgi:PAS domain S-box-containing protein